MRRSIEPLLPHAPRCRVRTAVLAAVLAAMALVARGAHAVEVGEAAPPVVLPGRDAEVSVAALKGKVVFLDFWASWCVPCRQSFPWMNQMQAKYGPRGLQVLAINLDTKRSEADAFLSQVPARFAIGFDERGESPTRYGVRGMPTSVLIGADGVVLLQHAGFRDADKPTLEAAIVAALGKIRR